MTVFFFNVTVKHKVSIINSHQPGLWKRHLKDSISWPTKDSIIRSGSSFKMHATNTHLHLTPSAVNVQCPWLNFKYLCWLTLCTPPANNNATGVCNRSTKQAGGDSYLTSWAGHTLVVQTFYVSLKTAAGVFIPPPPSLLFTLTNIPSFPIPQPTHTHKHTARSRQI